MRKFYSILALSIVIIISGFICTAWLNYNGETDTYIVTDKDRIVDGDSSYYVVFVENDEGDTYVFKNIDTIWHLKFNSSDVQGELKIGERYTITTVGIRIPIFSMYRNIIKVVEAE